MGKRAKIQFRFGKADPPPKKDNIMFIQQDSLRHKTNYYGVTNKNLNFIDYGEVVGRNYNSDTLDVITNDGISLRSVLYMSSKLYDQQGEKSNGNKFNSASIDLPSVGSIVLITYIDGEVSHPVVLGCIPDVRVHRKTTASSAELDQGRRFYLHDSHYWEKVDKFGNQEMYFPDGSTISVSSTVVTNTDKLSDEDKFKLSTLATPQKTIRIKHASGATIRIDADGNIELNPATGKKIQMGATATKEVVLHGDSVSVTIPSGTTLGSNGGGPLVTSAPIVVSGSVSASSSITKAA